MEIEGWKIDPAVNTLTTSALNWVEPRRDPLVLDLDGGGITTSGINPAAPILFDQDGDGTMTATGWIASGEAIVVRDLNANGRIDSGRELFGDSTILTRGPNVGQLASNGFTALADLDANAAGVADGKFDASDAAFASVKLWKDVNQNGVSEAGELFSFANLGVQSINLAAMATSVMLIGGNTQTFSGTFTRVNGASGDAGTAELVGSLLLTNNNFYRQFTDDPAVTTAAKALPQMQGSGWVRDLREAMSLGTPAALALQAKVNAFATATTQAVQMALLDGVIVAWGNTATRTGAGSADAFAKFDHDFSIDGYGAAGPVAFGAVFGAALDAQGFNWRGVPASSADRAALLGKMLVDAGLVKGFVVEQYNTSPAQQLKTWTISVADAFAQSSPARAAEVRALEAFNGQRVLDGFVTNGLVNSQAGNIFVQTRLVRDLAAAQTASLDQAYDALQTSVYSALVVQTRLKPYLDSIGLVIDAGGVRFDTAAAIAMAQSRATTDRLATVGDLLDLQKYSGETLKTVGWELNLTLRSVLDLGPMTAEIQALLTSGGIVALATTDVNYTAVSASGSTVLGNAAANILQGGAGADVLHGMAGNDTLLAGYGIGNLLDGGDGDDILNVDKVESSATLNGGAGNDTLWATYWSYANTFDGGTGNDSITGAHNADTYRFKLGDGQDSITDFHSHTVDGVVKTDRIVFGAGIAPTDITALRSGNNLVFSHSNGIDKITVVNWFAMTTNQYHIENIEFANGTVWNSTTLTAAALVVNGTSAADTISGTIYNDTLNGMAGNDTLLAGGGLANVLNGGDGDDILNVDLVETAATLNGGAGNDTLWATYWSYANTFEGGTGNDSITGAHNADTYRFKLGDGQDTITDFHSYIADGVIKTDRIVFGAGIAPTDITSVRSGNNLVFSHSNGADKITVKDWFLVTTNQYHIESIEFANGTVWNSAALTAAALVVTGTSAADTITGTPYNDTINGMAGDDQIDGGDGADVLFGGTGNDTLLAGYGIGNLLDGGDGDDILNVDKVESSATLNGGAGNDTLWATYWSYANTFEGGTGNDSITGAHNADTYRFKLGDGQDTITDFHSYIADGIVKTDRIVFGAGIASTDITSVRSGNNLVFSHSNGTDKITVKDWFLATTNQYHVESIEFANGTIWSSTALTATALLVTGTSAADIIGGTNYNDTINGMAGNDTLLAGGGSANVLNGGDGDDNLQVELNETAATLNGGAGNDTLSAVYWSYANTFEGGTGNDLITGAHNADTYHFKLGDGQDTITDFHSYIADGIVKTDRIIFGAGIAPADITALRSGNNMVFSHSNGTDKITVKDWFLATTNQYQIESIEFANGTVWTNTQATAFTTGNIAPTVAALSAAETYTEDTAKNLVDIVVTDADSANVTVTLTLSNVAAGSLNVGISGAVTSTYAAGTGVWTASGAKANVNTLLAALTFTPAANFNSNFSIATSVSDGVAAAVTGSKPFTGTEVNDLPTGTVTIVGIAAQGQTLTAANTLADVDGLGTLAYQWKAAGVVIAGATASSFVLTSAQVGKAITVSASYTDGKGTAEAASSAATAAVVAAAAAITGTAGADTLTGTSGADQIFGLGGNDSLAGGAGNDTLSGGGGFDSATFSGLSTGYTVTRSAGQVTVSGADGVDVLTSVEQLRFTDKSVFIRAAVADFDADGKSDLLWRNVSTGDDVVWKAANQSNPQAVTSATASWRVAGVADFSGDGKADILWRDTISGANALWLAGSSAQTQAVSSVLDQSWKIAGIGDFDGDTVADILWRNISSGANAIWKSANSSTGQTVVTVADQYWKLAGIADFDGDGKDDMLWRNFLSGSNVIWKSANNTTGQAVDSVAVAWRVAGLGDFNGDGKDDILWRNATTGANALWNGGNAADALTISAVADLNFAVAAVGDYNGDGRADIAWRNATTGSGVIWGAGNSATPITLVGVTDVNWANPAQTGTWVDAAGFYL